MKLINDIKEFFKDNTEHHLRLEISSDGVSIYLEYDPTGEYDSSCVIPIHYTTVEEFSYIPHDEYVKIFNPSDFGIDRKEIKLIGQIMDYIEENKEYINNLCYGLDFQERDCYKSKYGS